MALVEVEDSELQTLRTARALVEKFHGDPRTREQYLKLIKILNPQAIVPEIDAKNEVLDEIKKRDEVIADLKKAIDADKAERDETARKAKVEGSISDGRKWCRDQGYTQDGITGIEKIMEERGIADYEAAAALFERINPRDEPIVPSDFSKSWDFMKPAEADEDHKLLLKDPKGFQQKMVRQWMTEQRQQSPRRR